MTSIAIKLGDKIKLDGIPYYLSGIVKMSNGSTFDRYVSDDGEAIAVQWRVNFKHILRHTSRRRRWETVEATYAN